jgi:hypothetical protein
MNRKRQSMHEAIAVKPRIWEVVKTNPLDTTEPPSENGEFSWGIRFLLWIGAIMVKPDTPKGWGWNPSVIGLGISVVTLLLVIAGLIAAGGFWVGHQQAEIEFMRQQNQQTQAIAVDASKQATYAVKQSDTGDGHMKDDKKKEGK